MICIFFILADMCILNFFSGVGWNCRLISEIHNPLSLSKMSPERRAFLPFLKRKLVTVWNRIQQISLSYKGKGNNSPLVVFVSY